MRTLFCIPHRTEHKCQRHKQQVHAHGSVFLYKIGQAIPRAALREILFNPTELEDLASEHPPRGPICFCFICANSFYTQ